MEIDPEAERRAAIVAAKNAFDAANPPTPDVLPRDSWTVAADDGGHQAHFTEDEVARCGEVFTGRDEARAFARELYSQESGFFFPQDMMSALSLLSPELHERVRNLSRETEHQANERVAEFRERLARWHDAGSPPDGFPEREA